jgi:hypothetical protein
MLLSSFALANVEINVETEACFQNFAAGLILAAGE